MFVGEAFIHIGHAYSMSGLIIVLYKAIALLNDSLLLLLSKGFSWINFILVSFIFSVMWDFQFSLVSKFSPRYLIVSFCGIHGIVLLFIWSGAGVENGLSEKILLLIWSG